MNSKIKVILAEESKDFGVPCATALRSFGYDVISVRKDGTELVNRISSINPDVVVMDAFMPGLDAIGVLKSVKCLKLTRQPVVIVLSSFDNEKLGSQIISEGADYYFIKPVDYGMLAQRMNQLVNWNDENLK